MASFDSSCEYVYKENKSQLPKASQVADILILGDMNNWVSVYSKFQYPSKRQNTSSISVPLPASSAAPQTGESCWRMVRPPVQSFFALLVGGVMQRGSDVGGGCRVRTMPWEQGHREIDAGRRGTGGERCHRSRDVGGTEMFLDH